eukprot:m.238396 g.238396  ORF g.238396 m.238396 type:complete len:370 (-) comp13297_c0_seq1:99-1208(-)
MAEQKPRVLILGGMGFIGRNALAFLVEKNLTSFLRVADKQVASTAYLAPRYQAALQSPGVNFVQANLAREDGVKKAFTHADGEFDYVFNCAGITKNGQDDDVYKDNILQISVLCAAEAAKRNVKKYVELSTAHVYAADKNASTEKGKTDPWTRIAHFKLLAEEKIAAIPGLQYNILRPAIVYGPGDVQGLMPRLIIGAVYKHLGETMKLLWTAKLRLNTVHVTDVVAAMWHVATTAPGGIVFNLADSADTTQGSVTDMISTLFGIKSDYHGQILSNLARLNMKDAVEDANEKHVVPWSEICTATGVTSTPLSPYIDQELLYNNSLCVDGTAICATGFKYSKPGPTLEDLKECVAQYVDMKLFPPGMTVA